VAHWRSALPPPPKLVSTYLQLGCVSTHLHVSEHLLTARVCEHLLHMPAGRGPCGHVHTCRANACSNMAGAHHQAPAGMHNQAPPRAHAWTMWTKQKTIAHMVHMHAPGFSGVGEVWTMWALWTMVLNPWLIILYTVIVYTLHFLSFLSFYCPHCPQSPFFIGAPRGQFRVRASSAFLPT
jgi:hypothetical protein